MNKIQNLLLKSQSILISKANFVKSISDKANFAPKPSSAQRREEVKQVESQSQIISESQIQDTRPRVLIANDEMF